MAGNTICCNKETKNPTFNCSQHAHNGLLQECGGVKAPSTTTYALSPPEHGSVKVPPPTSNSSGGAKVPPTTTLAHTPFECNNAKVPPSTEKATLPKPSPKKGSKQKQKATPLTQPEAPQTPTPSIRISPEPGTNSPMRNGSKACEEITISMMENTIDTVNKNLKAMAKHKERYQKVEAKTAAEE
ncbi:hypothetical protein BGX38DRAFT_1278530 [Terfezia claveryi]|nr:hypothetical protein BGX38DRAFT_1278530 [Terfezia claveryi]